MQSVDSHFSSINPSKPEFITGDDSELAQWSADDDDPHIVLQMSLQVQQKYTEINQIAQDAIEFYAFKKVYSLRLSP